MLPKMMQRLLFKIAAVLRQLYCVSTFKPVQTVGGMRGKCKLHVLHFHLFWCNLVTFWYTLELGKHCFAWWHSVSCLYLTTLVAFSDHSHLTPAPLTAEARLEDWGGDMRWHHAGLSRHRLHHQPLPLPPSLSLRGAEHGAGETESLGSCGLYEVL